MGSLPRLKSVTIGDESLHIRQNEEGNSVAVWPWTGRIDEWVLEQVPILAYEEVFDTIPLAEDDSE